ncbi:NACHT domain-containing protein [Marinomonas shanghaiensis]|uniref:NACHT domain-containing protein n=1 Tax=Marinomonas shanghaiensis TaxID=2202418 RepID=UPI000DBA61EC|nr:hypothetical protein [Marinomonas shanghaiensis]
MPEISIPRTFWYDTEDKRLELYQAELLDREEPLIILGEAGMGKSHLLKQLAQSDTCVLCTAKRLIASQQPESIIGDATILVIDALDEVSAKNDGDALDKVLSKLELLGNPRFILSCRAAEWQNATGTSLIKEFYNTAPLALHIKSLQDPEILEYLGSNLDNERALFVLEHFKGLGLEELLGNPQTLSMIEKISMDDHLPESKSEVYKLAVEKLATEHNDKKETGQLAETNIIDTAGAAFAGLILTGKEGISRKAVANTAKSDVCLVDLGILSNVENLKKVTNSRLFIAIGDDRFSYIHRSIGEYLGARWLAKQANTARKRRRLLAIFQSYGVVPANLRGIHAWLSQDHELASNVLSVDPMGVIEYSGTDNLSPNQSNILLDALIKLANDNPNFTGWKSYSAKGLINQKSAEKSLSLIAYKSTPFALRILLLEAFQDSPLAESYDQLFNNLSFDTSEYFAIRSAALNLLANIRNKENWLNIAKNLADLEDNDSLRLAEEFINTINFESIDDELIVNLTIKYAQSHDNTALKFYSLARNLPIERISNTLDQFSEKLSTLGEWYERSGHDDMADLVCTLLCRLIAKGEIYLEKMWYWLTSIQPQTQSRRDSEKLTLLIEEKSLRTSIHVFAFLSKPNTNIREQSRLLQHSFPALGVNENDVITLLGHLNPFDKNDTRWRDLLLLCYHNGVSGEKVREAAQEFAKQYYGDLTWLNELANPPLTEWEETQTLRIELDEAKKAARHKQHREEYSEKIQELIKGEFSWLVNPARAYLRMFNDIEQDLPAHKRVVDWLGDDISKAALSGFETYLKSNLFEPDTIAKTHLENKRYDAEFIFIAAIAERLRKGQVLNDLSDKCLLVCLFSHWGSLVSVDYAKIGDIGQYLEQEVINRNLIKSAYQRYVEPQLQANKTSIHCLYKLLRDENLSNIACELTSNWLLNFPNLSSETEIALLKKLINSGHNSTVLTFLKRISETESIEQQRNRLAARLIVDFEVVKSEIEESVEAELLWNIQDLLPKNNTPKLTAWIIKSFRNLWPIHDYPVGGWSGRSNKWDASKFISNLINQLATNTSDEVIQALHNLRDQGEDGYSNQIKSVIAEQNQRIVEQRFILPDLKTIKAIIDDSTPTTIDDLQSYLIEELAVVQAKIKADDIESWQGFYDDNKEPYKEERCRDHLLGLLRQNINDIDLVPESHVASDKEVDITCSVTGGIRLPIEIKGQWHKDLWTAADKQLDTLYTTDHQAQGCGVYLVLWFGLGSSKKLKNRGKGKEQPMTASELQKMLEEDCLAAKHGRIKIVVIDIERSQQTK